MAPGGGIEPPTNRLTGGRSASELPRSDFGAETRNRTSDKSSSGSRLTTKLFLRFKLKPGDSKVMESSAYPREGARLYCGALTVYNF